MSGQESDMPFTTHPAPNTKGRPLNKERHQIA
jgi:hypothetical protein